MYSLAFQWLMDLEDFLFGVLSCLSFLLMKVAFSADSWWVSLMFSPSLSLISHKRFTDASHPSWEEEKQYALQDLWDRVGFGRPGFIQLPLWFQAAADTDVTCCCVAGIRKVPLYHTAVRLHVFLVLVSRKLGSQKLLAQAHFWCASKYSFFPVLTTPMGIFGQKYPAMPHL